MKPLFFPLLSYMGKRSSYSAQIDIVTIDILVLIVILRSSRLRGFSYIYTKTSYLDIAGKIKACFFYLTVLNIAFLAAKSLKMRGSWKWNVCYTLHFYTKPQDIVFKIPYN